RGLELGGSQPDVRMTPETPRKDAGGLDGRRVVETPDGEQRTERKPPAPAVATRIILGIPGDLDHREDVLPAGRVTDGEIALLHAGTFRRRMGAQCRRVPPLQQEAARRPAHEEPVLP